MAYRVIWRERATDQMTQLWLSGRDRYRINDAVDRLDQALAVQPLQLGESRDLDERIAILEPIGCRFRVDPLNKIVTVEALWRSR